jgi:hypothetical protein
MARKPTKRQLADQELLQNAMQVYLAAGAKVLQDEFRFSDHQSGHWILSTAALLAEHIGTDEAKAEIVKAREVLEGA